MNSNLGSCVKKVDGMFDLMLTIKLRLIVVGVLMVSAHNDRAPLMD